MTNSVTCSAWSSLLYTHIHQIRPTLSMSACFPITFTTDAHFLIFFFTAVDTKVQQDRTKMSKGEKIFEFFHQPAWWIILWDGSAGTMVEAVQQTDRLGKPIRNSSEKQRGCQAKITSLKCWRKRKVLTRMFRKNVALRDARFFCFSLPFTGTCSRLLFFSLLRTHVSPPPSLHAQLPIWRVNNN